ncbi:hypothetical protein GGD63_001074 [Bradyrhizobium sp. cir1]|nr:hypothetical protein [Bradyrhizobium sp. cir1]
MSKIFLAIGLDQLINEGLEYPAHCAFSQICFPGELDVAHEAKQGRTLSVRPLKRGALARQIRRTSPASVEFRCSAQSMVARLKAC